MGEHLKTIVYQGERIIKSNRTGGWVVVAGMIAAWSFASDETFWKLTALVGVSLLYQIACQLDLVVAYQWIPSAVQADKDEDN